jgi:hypothetical protein
MTLKSCDRAVVQLIDLGFCCTQYVFMDALVVAVHKWSLCVRRLVVTMASCSEHVDKSPVRMSSTRRLFNTPVVPDDDVGNTDQSIVMPVM